MSDQLFKERFRLAQEVIGHFREKKLPVDDFCLVPFTTIILEPNGSVGICRHKGTKFSMGNIKDESILDIWNGENVRRWRREFLQGEAQICRQEIDHRHCNLCPQNNKLLDDVDFSEYQTRPILKLTANFNGFCNLQCQMCDVWKLPNGLYNEMNFWGPAEKEIFPHLKEIDMLSGEPFLQTDTYRLIDAVSNVNKDCLWTITTNAHWKLNKRIKSYLDKIKLKVLVISIDSLIPEVYHEIRYPGQLSVVLENLDRILEYNKEREERGLGSFDISVNFLIMKNNWKEAESAVDFFSSKGIHPLITYCYEPIEYSLSSLNESQKMEILNFYLESIKEWNKFAMILKVIRPIVDELSAFNKIDVLDRIRQLKEAHLERIN